MRKIQFSTGEFYHIFNRGSDKRDIFSDQHDIDRFMLSMNLFNTKKPIGSLYEHSFRKDRQSEPLVHIVAYNLLSNHFHLLLKQVADNGISNYMKRLLGGYTWYFNNKNKRTGVLFQGKFKATYIDTNEYLLYVSAYINSNHLQKKSPLGDRTAKLQFKNSWNEYMDDLCKEKYCEKEIILDQFGSSIEYEKFVWKALEEIQHNKTRYALLEE